MDYVDAHSFNNNKTNETKNSEAKSVPSKAKILNLTINQKKQLR